MTREEAEEIIHGEIERLSQRGWSSLAALDGKRREQRSLASGEAYWIEIESFLDRSDWDEADRHVLVRVRPRRGLRRLWAYGSGFEISHDDEVSVYPQRIA